jgi:hypothetical protein
MAAMTSHDLIMQKHLEKNPPTERPISSLQNDICLVTVSYVVFFQ